jgi:dihydroorotate dehydrogenase
VIRHSDAQAAHDATISLMRGADRLRGMRSLAGWVNRATLPRRPTIVGGVTLPHPLIVAAGLVKGDGFPDEMAAVSAVRRQRNVIPGWRTMPALLGAVEFGSFTRHPRTGNRGRVVWRDDAARSMQNRVGLRNPGAVAAAAWLRSKGHALPAVWGVNLAASPGVGDIDLAAGDIEAAAAAFARAFAGHPRRPAWYTLNLSCPNTEDDPESLQTDQLARRLGAAIVSGVEGTPVWVKVGPGLSREQYRTLARAFADTGVRVVIATNTLARLAPRSRAVAGVSGAGLRNSALDAVTQLSASIAEGGWDIDVVACGGIGRGSDLVKFMRAGARAGMLYSALVFRGPLAPALILREAEVAGWHG